MQTIKRWIFLVAVWVLKQVAHDILIISEQVLEVMRHADPLVGAREAQAHIPGEAKKRQVYAALIKAHPHIPKHVISLAIDLVVHRRRVLGP